MPPGRSILSRLCLLAVLLVTAADAAGDAADSSREPIVVKDPQYGEVLFYFYQEDYFPAIVRVLAAQDRDQLKNHAAEAELLLGGMYLSYGHHLEAAEIFERILAGNVDPEVRDRTWFFLAKIWYQRGYLEKARQALEHVKGRLPDNLRREALMLDAQILIDAGQYDTAIAKLQRWKGRTEWASYARFNIGVAMVRSGRVDEATELLDALGAMDPHNEELAALRDKANLALGYALLKDGKPDAALVPLQRVRLEGPFSNKALLGTGWADAENENYERALVPWMELRGRDLLDSAVQESMLAVPFAMAKLDAISQAADFYVDAIEAFDEETNRINLAISNIESGNYFEEFIDDDLADGTGWYWRLEKLPDGPEARYLYHLLAAHEFQEGLKNFRDLTQLHRNLDNWQQNVDVYVNMLETRKEAFDQRLAYVEGVLARADLDRLISNKLELDSTLNNVEQTFDWLALANESEFDTWGNIAGIEATPALSADIDEAYDTRDKIDLLKGVMQWNLERDFGDRLWRVRSALQETGEALVETQRARRQIDESMRRETLRFADFGERVDGLAPRIEEMKMRVETTLLRQRGFMQALAIKELREQKKRLDIYSIQARFALAAIYDVSSLEGEAAE